MTRDKRPEQVFTPRSSTVNDEMYVERPGLQVSLAAAMRGSLHVVIHGESGTGKSWLYKHVFKQNKIHMAIANMANAARLGSLNAEFANIVDAEGTPQTTTVTEKKEVALKIPIASASIDHVNSTTIGQKEPFERCLQFIRARAGSHSACLVIDNLEHIFSVPEFMKQLGSIIVLLDDPRYARYAVKIALVGVPDDVKRYFARADNLQTVANRLYEIPEVDRLTKDQTFDFVKRGLLEQLHYRVSNSPLHPSEFPTIPIDEIDGDPSEIEETDIINEDSLDNRRPARSRREDVSNPSEELQILTTHIAWVTDRIPQQMHEYCLELARLAEVNAGIISIDLLKQADQKYFIASLTSNYTAIENMMNARATTAGRRNQVLFTLGQCTTEDFSAAQIEKLLRRNFPNSSKAVQLNIPQTFYQLSSGPTPVIKPTPKGDKYRFVHPKYRMAIRVMLKKTYHETVEAIAQEYLS